MSEGQVQEILEKHLELIRKLTTVVKRLELRVDALDRAQKKPAPVAEAG